MPILEPIPEPALGKPGWNTRFKQVLDRTNSMPETILDIFAQKVVAGPGISINYNSATKVFTINNTGGGGEGGVTGMDFEALMDYLAANLTVNGSPGEYDDPAGTINFTVSTTGGGGPFAISDVTGLQTALDSKAGAASTGAAIWIGTQAAYDALSSKSTTTLYAITS